MEITTDDSDIADVRLREHFLSIYMPPKTVFHCAYYASDTMFSQAI